MKLTIGMASYKNAEQIWWTVEALRLYHDLTDVEILVVDNFGDDNLQKWCEYWKVIKYVRYTDVQGTAMPRHKIFEHATGDFVLVIDSHVMFFPDSIAKLKKWIDDNPNSNDLIHGLMYYDGLDVFVDRMEPVWRGNMFGIWGENLKTSPSEPYEIPMHGLGIFGCFRNKWLGFNPGFRGFGGEEGYIHEKFRKAGHKGFIVFTISSHPPLI
jgi:glycosyltransferase involved in cell wall biosynthesis